MEQKPHVIHIGTSPYFFDAIDFTNYRNSIVVHTHVANLSDEGVKNRFAGFEVIDVPHTM